MKRIFFSTLLMMFGANFALADCPADFAQVLQSFKTAGPYHVTMDQSANGKTRKMEVDVILPSSFHMKSPEMEAVMLSNGEWMKIKGKWMAMPAMMSKMTTNAINQGFASGMKGMKNLQCLGPQPIDGTTLSSFAFDSSGQAMGIKASSHVVMYVDANQKPSVMIIDGTAMGMKSKTVQHITYDPSIQIIAPK